jgi:hypothetical protein
VNLFDTTAYITAGEADLDLQLFSRVLQNQKVQKFDSDLSILHTYFNQVLLLVICLSLQLLTKLFKLIDFSGTGNVSVQSVIVFIMDLSLPR